MIWFKKVTTILWLELYPYPPQPQKIEKKHISGLITFQEQISFYFIVLYVVVCN